jgi:porin
MLVALPARCWPAEEALPDFCRGHAERRLGRRARRRLEEWFRFEGLARVDALRNRGGISNGSRHITHLDLKLKMDLEKAVGWSGGSAMVNVLSDGGWGPNARHVGAQMGVTNAEVNAPTTTRLFQAWLQQSLFDDRLAVLAGLYPIDSEFFTMDSAGVFSARNTALRQTWGRRAARRFSTTRPSACARSGTITKTVYAMGAVLDGIPNDPARPKRRGDPLRQGRRQLLDRRDRLAARSRQRQVQGSRQDRDRPLGLQHEGERPARYRCRWQPLAALSARRLPAGRAHLARLGGEERFISGFARYTWGDGDSTAVKNSLNLGLHAKGPLASRPDDVVGFAWSRAGMSRKWRDAQAVPGNTKASEDALEITWRFAVTPWLAIQPNYQYIKHPGGAAAAQRQADRYAFRRRALMQRVGAGGTATPAC